MGGQVLYAEDLPKIPSEYLNPYLQRFLMSKLECVAMGYNTADEAKAELKVIDCFVSMFGGIHSRYAMMNEYNRINDISNEDLIKIAKSIFNN